MSEHVPSWSRRIGALANVATAIATLGILVTAWAFMSVMSEMVSDDDFNGFAAETICTDYATKVLDLQAQGYTAKQITKTFVATRAHREDGTYLAEVCGTPLQIITTAGPVKK